MNREKVLILLLTVSLCANAYFVVFQNNSPAVKNISSGMLYAYRQAFPLVNSSGQENYSSMAMVDTVNPTSTPEVMPTLEMRSGQTPQPPGTGTTAEEAVENTSEPLGSFLSGNYSEPPLYSEFFSDNNTSGWVNETPGTETANVSPGAAVTEPASENLTVPGSSPANNATTSGPQPWKTYRDETLRFSIQYPPSWEFTGSAGSSPGFTAPVEKVCDKNTAECYQYTAKLVVIVIANPVPPDLEDYFNAAVASLQQQYGITASSKSAPTTLSGNKAYWIEYFSRDERGNPTKNFMQYYTILDKKAYILTYSGPYSTGENIYSRNKPDAQRMIDSFTVEREYRVV